MFHLFRMKKRTYNCWTIFQSFVQSEAPKVRKIEGFFFQFLFPLWLYLSIYKQGLYIRGHLRLDLKMPKGFQKSLKNDKIATVVNNNKQPLLCSINFLRNSSPMFSIIFQGFGEIFHVVFRNFSG